MKKTDGGESLGVGGRIILKRIRWLGLHSSGLSQEKVNEVSVCVKYWEFFQHLRRYWLTQKGKS
jgi:hypothetical protein